jgi:hypothetical protein
MTANGFKELVRYPPTETVIGVIGKFWRLTDPQMQDFGDAEGFTAFDRPGFGKGVMNLHVWPEGDGSILSTETRVTATDEASRKKFARYWRVIQPGSGLIRRALLRAVKVRAESA